MPLDPAALLTCQVSYIKGIKGIVKELYYKDLVPVTSIILLWWMHIGSYAGITSMLYQEMNTFVKVDLSIHALPGEHFFLYI